MAKRAVALGGIAVVVLLVIASTVVRSAPDSRGPTLVSAEEIADSANTRWETTGVATSSHSSEAWRERAVPRVMAVQRYCAVNMDLHCGGGACVTISREQSTQDKVMQLVSRPMLGVERWLVQMGAAAEVDKCATSRSELDAVVVPWVLPKRVGSGICHGFLEPDNVDAARFATAMCVMASGER